MGWSTSFSIVMKNKKVINFAVWEIQYLCTYNCNRNMRKQRRTASELKRTGPNVVARFETFILFSALASATLPTNSNQPTVTVMYRH